MNNQQTKLQEIAHGKKIAHEAEMIWGLETPAGKKRAERRGYLIVSLAGIRAGKKVLEVGCGTGVYTEKLAKIIGADIFAIDISPDLLSKARDKIGYANVNFIEADLENLPFPDESFDAVVGVSILHHVGIDEALREIRRVLRPGGSIVFSEPNMMNPQIVIQKNISFIKKRLGDSPGETAFFRWQLSRILENAGFVNVKVVPFDFLHPLMPEKLINFTARFGLILEKFPVVKEFAGSLLISAHRS